MHLGRIAALLAFTIVSLGGPFGSTPAVAETLLRCDGLSRNSIHLRVEIACAEPGSISRSVLPSGCELVFIDVLDVEAIQTREAFRLSVRALPPTSAYRAFVSDEHDVDLTLFPRNAPFSVDRSSDWLAARREARLTVFYRDIFMITSMGCEILESGR